MAKKLLLDYEDESPYFYLGISSNIRDYQMVFYLIKKLKLQFKHVEAFQFSKGNKEYVYSLYLYNDFENMINYYLISNKYSANRLNPEFKHLDFFIILEGEIDDFFVMDLAKKIKQLPNVLFSTLLDASKFDKIQNLRYEFDLHLEKVLKIL
ncbi:MAG: IPExxxVDY family protein [Bacteroidetes bacterium]|nr:MAG: IPExxxVDY family protein [Bacteroidota bacterium]